MKRKLISILLSIFAMLLLMGAAANPDPAAALVPEEESTASTDAALETDIQILGGNLLRMDRLHRLILAQPADGVEEKSDIAATHRLGHSHVR